jgi:hypothetical protein
MVGLRSIDVKLLFSKKECCGIITGDGVKLAAVRREPSTIRPGW